LAAIWPLRVAPVIKDEANVQNLKFAPRSDRARSELQIQEAHWNYGFAGVAGDSEIRPEPSISTGEFPNRHTSAGAVD
jgi:hypothetical protein